MAIDVSSSMLSQDLKPDRLTALKRVAETFVEDRTSDRIGLVVYAGESYTKTPITSDKSIVKRSLREITFQGLIEDGTAIGMAIANATNRLRDSESKSRIMILLSDGSNNAGEIDPATAATIANKFNVKIYTIAAGTEQSFSRIPGRGLIRNEIDTKTLKDISLKTGGQFFRATDKDALADIYKEIDKLERSEIEVKDYTKYKELYNLFLIPAIIIVFLYIIIKKYLFRVRV